MFVLFIKPHVKLYFPELECLTMRKHDVIAYSLNWSGFFWSQIKINMFSLRSLDLCFENNVQLSNVLDHELLRICYLKKDLQNIIQWDLYKIKSYMRRWVVFGVMDIHWNLLKITLAADILGQSEIFEAMLFALEIFHISNYQTIVVKIHIR